MSKHRHPSSLTLETKILIWAACLIGLLWLLSQFTTAL